MRKELLYPLWLRIWHWFNAFLFLILIISGISMHYSASNDLLLPFDIAMYTHNVAGIILSFIFVYYTIFNIASGNFRHYLPSLKNFTERMVKQATYYVYGVFKGHPHPYHTDSKNKFNPLQQLTYFAIMFFMMPLIIISGWLLMFPELAPENVLGMGGVWPMAILHIVVGFFLSLFMFGHIYLATHGETVSANFKSMIDGYHISHDSEHSEQTDEVDENLMDSTIEVEEYIEENGSIEFNDDDNTQNFNEQDSIPDSKEQKL
ncbi:MAG: cytochrome b/b6 domain-containing protein [Candidatus Kapabacteria bacterium]|jgi:thiosulfate reductase cytochrome b subunit|nr:cytochrome b/b6 domain-containing protein [Candidatus Kapabacteria bacterium]